MHYQGSVPSLKNNRLPVDRKDGRRVYAKNPKVTQYITNNKGNLKRQYRKQGYVTVPRDIPMAIFVLFYQFGATGSDTDGGLSLIYDTLQVSEKPSGIVGAIEDDKQIISPQALRLEVNNVLFAGASVYLWSVAQKPVHTILDEMNRMAFQAYKKSRDLPNPVKIPEMLISVDDT